MKYQPGEIQNDYPLLWSFFNGASLANCLMPVGDGEFEGFSIAELEQAETELERVATELGEEAIYVLGRMADGGYTLWGQTKQETDGGDDEQHTLLAFTLLDSRY